MGLLTKLLDWILPGGISVGPTAPPEPESHLVTKSVSATLCRLHSRRRFHPEEFWRTFHDDDRKWAAQERFAGSQLNCGHYFALTAEGARAEAAFYKMRTEERVLLEARVTLPSIIDLTHAACMRHALSIYAADPEEVKQNRVYRVLSFLADEIQAGNDFTDLIGRWAAVNQASDGILFFSARSLSEHQRRLLYMPDHMFELDEACGFTQEEEVEDWQKEPGLLNLVAFSGARLTGAVEAFRIDGGKWQSNPWCGMAEEALDEVLREHGFPWDSGYQDEMRHRVVIRRGPPAPVEPWSPGKGMPRRMA